MRDYSDGHRIRKASSRIRTSGTFIRTFLLHSPVPVRACLPCHRNNWRTLRRGEASCRRLVHIQAGRGNGSADAGIKLALS